MVFSNTFEKFNIHVSFHKQCPCYSELPTVSFYQCLDPKKLVPLKTTDIMFCFIQCRRDLHIVFFKSLDNENVGLLVLQFCHFGHIWTFSVQVHCSDIMQWHLWSHRMNPHYTGERHRQLSNKYISTFALTCVVCWQRLLKTNKSAPSAPILLHRR